MDFAAEWCGPCRTLGKVLDKMEQDYDPDDVVFAHYDAGGDGIKTAAYNVRNLPTLILFQHGQPVNRLTGAQTPETIAQFISDHLD